MTLGVQGATTALWFKILDLRYDYFFHSGSWAAPRAPTEEVSSLNTPDLTPPTLILKHPLSSCWKVPRWLGSITMMCLPNDPRCLSKNSWAVRKVLPLPLALSQLQGPIQTFPQHSFSNTFIKHLLQFSNFRDEQAQDSFLMGLVVLYTIDSKTDHWKQPRGGQRLTARRKRQGG